MRQGNRAKRWQQALSECTGKLERGLKKGGARSGWYGGSVRGEWFRDQLGGPVMHCRHQMMVAWAGAAGHRV